MPKVDVNDVVYFPNAPHITMVVEKIETVAVVSWFGLHGALNRMAVNPDNLIIRVKAKAEDKPTVYSEPDGYWPTVTEEDRKMGTYPAPGDCPKCHIGAPVVSEHTNEDIRCSKCGHSAPASPTLTKYWDKQEEFEARSEEFK